MPLLKKQKQPSLQSQLRQQCRLASFQLLVSSVHQYTEDKKKKKSLLFQLAFWSALLLFQICRFSGLLINLFHTYSSADASHCSFRPTSSQELSAGGWSQRCDCSRQSPSWQFNPTPARTQQNHIIIGVKGDLAATSTGESWHSSNVRFTECRDCHYCLKFQEILITHLACIKWLLQRRRQTANRLSLFL